MLLPNHKTKIVATIGPASESPAVLEQMIHAGMNVARLNFSHGEFDAHRRVIENIRAASKATGQRVAIMADLSGPKMRVGKFGVETIQLKAGDKFTLTTDDIVGDQRRVSVSFAKLPKVVKPGNVLSLNDGYIQLEVTGVQDANVACVVKVGGELRSRKGLNLPHRPRHQRVHRPRPGMPEFRARTRRGRREPVVCRGRGGSARRARGGALARTQPVSDREDREIARARPARRDS
jgi:pyruvate kinase